MKLLLAFLVWCVLFAVSWPLALLAAVLFPFVWIVCLPFRLVGIIIGPAFALLSAVLHLPARILGGRPRRL